MKKTIIALFALAGLASAVDVITTDLMPTDYDWKSYSAPEGGESEWVNVTWGSLSTSNLETDFSLLSITSAGSYGFNNKGTGQASAGQITLTEEDSLVITGRNGWAAVETLFARVVEVSSLLGNYKVNNLTALTLNVTYTRSAEADGWVGLYVLDSSNKLTDISEVSSNALKTGTGDDVSIAFNADQLNNLEDSDKLVVLFRDGSKGHSTTITSLSTVATAVPEPTTATLSLLALAGLAARRRRK